MSDINYEIDTATMEIWKKEAIAYIRDRFEQYSILGHGITPEPWIYIPGEIIYTESAKPPKKRDISNVI